MENYAIFDQQFFISKPAWMPQKLYEVVCHRSNPRSAKYMETILRKSFSNAKLISPREIPHGADRYILLYPDAIGLGWSHVEKRVLGSNVPVTVINGRGRSFELTSFRRQKLQFRRLLESTFLPEIILTPFIVIVGAALSIWDSLLGRN